MECKLYKIKTKNRIPEIGEVWQRNGPGQAIYMRIYDFSGRDTFNAYSVDFLDKMFFSVDLSVGNIIYTSLDCEDIIILKPKQVVDGIIEFEPVD